jgi:hypothetical protein
MGSTVADQYSIQIARIQFLSLFLGHIDEGLCANSNEMGDVRPLAMEGFVRCPSIEGGLRFSRWATVQASSAQSSFGSFVLTRMAWILSQIVLFARCVTPFCSGAYGAVSS